MKKVAILVLLLVVSACGRDPYKVCFGSPSQETCKNFESQSEYKAWEANERKRQRDEARAFPDDFREIVAVVLKEFLGEFSESAPVNARYQFFVSVFGQDIDAATQSKLVAQGLGVSVGSKYVPSRIDASGTHLANRLIYVSSMKRLNDGAYDVELGYFCGSLCAGHFRYRVKRDTSQWVFLSKEALWYS